MAICSKSEKCITDIRKKLEIWQLSDSELQKVIDALVDEKFIDEQRFAESFVRDKFRFNYWGKIKIAYYLKAKGISKTLIDRALSQIADKEYSETLHMLLKQKNKIVKANSDYEKKAKIVRFAQGRGFEYDNIAKLIDKL